MALIKPTNLTATFGDIERKRTGYTVREAAILTNSYVVCTHDMDLRPYEYAGVFFEIVQGGLTSLEYIIWQSHDLTTWFRKGAESVAASVITDTAPYHTIALTGNLDIYKVYPMVGLGFRLSVKGTGVMANSLLTVHVTGVR